MQPYERVQSVAYFVFCLLVITAHEYVYGNAVGTERTLQPMLLLVVLMCIGAVAWQLVAPRLDRIVSYKSRRFSFIVADGLLYVAIGTGLLLIGWVALGMSLAVLIDYAVGVVVVGYFATIDNALARNLRWFTQDRITVEGGFTLVPLAQKFSVVLTVTILIVAATVSLSAYRILGSEFSGAAQVEQMPQQVLVALLLLFGAILALLLRLIHSYTRNIHAFLHAQMDVMRGIEKGELDQRAPLMAQDELGLMAVQINQMIEHLRDRDRLHKTLEKVVGSNIMEKLLTTDDETLKRGQEDEVAIMFCDMRDFTSMSEASSSEEIILFLNSFFADLSEIVARHDGTINKFMGDAILAVYGLDGEGNPVEDAVRSAFEILEHTRQFTLPDGKHPDMGAGIHFGTVMAGTIGSEARYEYTFLGDAVNTASRLEGLTKRLSYRIVVSRDAFAQLSPVAKHHFSDLGDQRVRGKAEPLHVYGTQKKEVR